MGSGLTVGTVLTHQGMGLCIASEIESDSKDDCQRYYLHVYQLTDAPSPKQLEEWLRAGLQQCINEGDRYRQVTLIHPDKDYALALTRAAGSTVGKTPILWRVEQAKAAVEQADLLSGLIIGLANDGRLGVPSEDTRKTLKRELEQCVRNEVGGWSTTPGGTAALLSLGEIEYRRYCKTGVRRATPGVGGPLKTIY